VKAEPIEEPSPPKADACDGPTLLHDSPTDSSPTAAEDLRSNNSPNEQPNIEPEPTTDSGPVRNSPPSYPTTKYLTPKNLWNEAYKALREKDQHLIDSYVSVLLGSQDPHQQGTSRQIGFFLGEMHQMRIWLSVYFRLTGNTYLQIHLTSKHY
jgi:hypothetical protein